VEIRALLPSRSVAYVVLFHASVGQTPGFLALAEQVRAAGHTVATPDLYQGRTFSGPEEGMAYAQEIGGPETLLDAGVHAVNGLPPDVVYAGVSMGVMPAQKLAQTRREARGALFLESCLPPDYFADSWPADVPVQVHGMDGDPYFAAEGDIDNARTLVAQAAHGELFVYEGERHLFTDSSLPSYDAGATRLVLSRMLTFLAAH
jgi:dienelactone hydrolase